MASGTAPNEAHPDAIQPIPPRSLESRRQFLRPSPPAVLRLVLLHIERSPPRTQDRRLKRIGPKCAPYRRIRVLVTSSLPTEAPNPKARHPAVNSQTEPTRWRLESFLQLET